MRLKEAIWVIGWRQHGQRGMLTGWRGCVGGGQADDQRSTGVEGEASVKRQLFFPIQRQL